jgi:tetratricopeptide (TPR) repeat protein
MPFPYIFTFYSYKGGVGRSLALMNVAYALAGRGRHVLMVDLDLEAPGISGFLQRNKELAEPDSAHPKDILTLLGEAIRTISASGATDESARSLPAVWNYTRAVAEAKLGSLRPKLGLLGRLDVLWTDLSREYWERLAELGLNDFPQEKLIALSRLLHDYFKAQVFEHRPLGVEEFEPPIPTPYDYILVDSRTGFTELGGLCVGPLADRLVVITGLNDQNVQGTLGFLKEAGIQPQPRSAQDTPWDDADAVSAGRDGDNPSLGPKPTIVVASPVPAGEITYKRQRLSELEQSLGIHPVPLSYHPQMALMESVFVRDYTEEYLAQEYNRLATRLMLQVGDAPQQLVSQAGVLWNQRKPGEAIACALRLAVHDPETGASLLGFFGHPMSESNWNLPEMRQLCAAMSQVPAERSTALNNWGNALSAQAKTRQGADADRLFAEASAKYAEALRLKPDYAEALYNWGVALSAQAKTKAGEEADLLFREARKILRKAESVSPGSGAYNLACVAALEGDPGEAIRWLRAYVGAGERLTRTRLRADGDFDSIRNQAEWASFVESLPED